MGRRLVSDRNSEGLWVLSEVFLVASHPHQQKARFKPNFQTWSLGRCIVDFYDHTNLHYVLIFPIMHKMAAKLFVEDFGVQNALKHYEHLVGLLTSDGTIRESQFKGFRWPEASPQNVPRVNELEAQLWKLARDLIGRGIIKETIASALLNIAVRDASKALDPPHVSVGFLINTLKELRAGLYTLTRSVLRSLSGPTRRPRRSLIVCVTLPTSSKRTPASNGRISSLAYKESVSFIASRIEERTRR
jgi:hypothetical protein